MSRTGSTSMPYHRFTKAEWSELRDDEPMTLNAADIERLRALNDPISLAEAEAIYLPLTRLLSLYVEAMQDAAPGLQRLPRQPGPQGALHHRRRRFGGGRQIDHLAHPAGPAAALAVLAPGRPRHHRRLPLSQRGARGTRADGPQGLSRKLRPRALHLLPRRHQVRQAARSRCRSIRISSTTSCPASTSSSTGPTSSSSRGSTSCSRASCRRTGKPILFASDFLDFSIYIDAEEADLRNWFMERFLRLRETAFRDPDVLLPPLQPVDANRKPSTWPSRSGSRSTCPTCATTSCRRAAAPT